MEYISVVLLHRDGPSLYEPEVDHPVPEVEAKREDAVQAARDWALLYGLTLPQEHKVGEVEGEYYVAFVLDEKWHGEEYWTNLSTTDQSDDDAVAQLKFAKQLIRELG